jgi:AcrR family transcriptional regulator
MKPIQEERMRGYFLNAAKDLIRAEGISAVSARNVAERAGYSYATLYNYFKDIRDLIFSCIEDFMKECTEFVALDAGGKPGRERLLKKVKGYAKFFLQHQGIFTLLYQQPPSDMSTKNSKIEGIHGFFNSIIDEDWNIVCAKSSPADKRANRVKEQFNYSMHGLLLFYLNGRKEMEFKDFLGEVAETTEFYANLAGE